MKKSNGNRTVCRDVDSCLFKSINDKEMQVTSADWLYEQNASMAILPFPNGISDKESQKTSFDWQYKQACVFFIFANDIYAK